MGGSLKKEEAEEAYAVWRDIAAGQKTKALTMEMLQAYWPNGTTEGIFHLVQKCKGNKKHPFISQFGYEEFLRGGILYSWAQFNPFDDVQEVEFDVFEEGLRKIRKGSDEEIHEIATIVCKRMDRKGSGKVTLRYFIEFAMKSYAEEKKPWAFVDDPKFLEANRGVEEEEAKPKKKKKVKNDGEKA